jgi:hypothetical protein
MPPFMPPMSADERDCAICYETKTDFIHCGQCVNEVCVDCFSRLPREECPFCKYVFPQAHPAGPAGPPPPLEPAVAFAVGDGWLFCIDSYPLRDMIRVLHRNWSDNDVNEAYLCVLNTIRERERRISRERHLVAEHERRRADLMRLSIRELTRMVRASGGRGYSRLTKEELVTRLLA